MAPGTYTVRLSVENQEFTRSLTVRKDPNSLGSEEEIRAQTEVVLEIRENVSAMADTINQIEWVRKQIFDINALLEDDANAEPVVAAGTALDEKLMALEGNFFDLRQTGQGDSGYYPPQLYSKVPGVARAISQSDFGPTASQVEMHESHTEQIAGHLRRLDGLLRGSRRLQRVAGGEKSPARVCWHAVRRGGVSRFTVLRRSRGGHARTHGSV